MQSEAYYKGFDAALSEYLAEPYDQCIYGYYGSKDEYDKGYKDGWKAAERIDASVD